ncbi:hypothetical protein STEG23_018221 [Scotinomys teguina]
MVPELQRVPARARRAERGGLTPAAAASAEPAAWSPGALGVLLHFGEHDLPAMFGEAGDRGLSTGLRVELPAGRPGRAGSGGSGDRSPGRAAPPDWLVRRVRSAGGPAKERLEVADELRLYLASRATLKKEIRAECSALHFASLRGANVWWRNGKEREEDRFMCCGEKQNQMRNGREEMAEVSGLRCPVEPHDVQACAMRATPESGPVLKSTTHLTSKYHEDVSSLGRHLRPC